MSFDPSKPRKVKIENWLENWQIEWSDGSHHESYQQITGAMECRLSPLVEVEHGEAGCSSEYRQELSLLSSFSSSSVSGH